MNRRDFIRKLFLLLSSIPLINFINVDDDIVWEGYICHGVWWTPDEWMEKIPVFNMDDYPGLFDGISDGINVYDD